MLHPIVRVLAVLVAFTVVASRAEAQGAPPPAAVSEPSVATFTVAITEPAELIEEVGTTRRLDQAELQVLHARTLDEALRLLPGVYVRTASDTPRIDVRGFRSRHVLLLIDGVPMNSTDDGQFDPRQIPTESIREIKVSYGASSILYGDNGMAGVIEVVTETPRPGVHGAMSVDAGKAAQGDGTGRISVGGGRASLVATGSAFSTDGFNLSGAFTPTALQNGGIRTNSDVDRRSALVKIGVAASDALKLGALVSLNRGSYGIPTSTISSTSDIFAQNLQYQRVDAYRNVVGQASFEWRPASVFNLRGWGYVNGENEDRARYDSATYSSIDDPLISGTYKERNETRITGGQLLGRVDLARAGWLRVTMNGRRESFDTSGVIRDVAVGGSGSGSGGGGGGGGGGGRGGTTATPTTYDLRAFDEGHRLDVYSTGAEWEFRPVARTGVVVGAAGNWQQREGSANGGGPAWLAGLTFDLNDAVRLHASGTRKIRFPSIRQLYDVASGDLALQAERANEVEAGATATWRDRGDASARRCSPLTCPASSSEIPAHATATATATRSLAPNSRSIRAHTPSWTCARRTASSTPRICQARRAAATSSTGQRIARSSTPDGCCRRGSRREPRGPTWLVRCTYSRTTPAVQARAENYTLVDASVSRALSSNYDVTMSVYNLFDRLYEQSYGQPRPGRTLLLSVNGRF